MEIGRWAYQLAPYLGGLRVFRLDGYSTDDELAIEKNRALCSEIIGAVTKLEDQLYDIAGDWNLNQMPFR
eukprot:2751087-Amphidinium_carterae.1